MLGSSGNDSDTVNGAVMMFKYTDLRDLDVWRPDISDWQPLPAHWQRIISQITREPQAYARYHAGRSLRH
jgi:hypothetical protein